jgi:hypothetical protein
MPSITNADVEAEARTLLRERIARLPWHAGLDPEERERRIAEDVDQHWPALVDEAIERLLDRARAPLTARKRT